MAYDYKKEYKEFYLPPRKPGMVTVPPAADDLHAKRLHAEHAPRGLVIPGGHHQRCLWYSEKSFVWHRQVIKKYEHCSFSFKKFPTVIVGEF